MTYRVPLRHVLLIAIAVLLPAGVLIGLARRLVRQEAELVEARTTKSKQEAVDQLSREFKAHLEAMKLQEISRRIRVPAPEETEPSLDSALVFAARLEENRVVLPWESSQRAPQSPAEFKNLIRDAELSEFARKDLSSALDFYRRALSRANASARCEARLSEARVLFKLGNATEAGRNYKAMLQNCAGARDTDGVPYSLYAAERLINALHDSKTAAAYLRDRATNLTWLNPNEAYLLRSLLANTAEPSTEEITAGVAALNTRIERMNTMRALAADFAQLQRQAAEGWVTYGAEPWLVTVIPPDPPLSSLIFAVSSIVAARRFLPADTSFVPKGTPGSGPFGEEFYGLHVKLPVDRFMAETGGVSSSLYAPGIALILAVTVLAGYLLLRDVNRGIRMAELRSHFVAGVSHELKTPLTAIRMFAETLALGRAPDEKARKEYLDTIVNESERLTRLVDNVLDFSKIEHGRKIYRMRPTCLPEVVRSAAQAMQYPLSQHGLTLNVSIDERINALTADGDALQQAILNLLSNALKYSGGGRHIDLSLKSDGGDAVIEVADTGIGIEPREQSRIFEKFYRTRSQETDLIAGAGLGLTIVRHVVEAHGGRVELRSEKGAGSVFSIRIPFSPAENPA